jgi:hypothetical protein
VLLCRGVDSATRDVARNRHTERYAAPRQLHWCCKLSSPTITYRRPRHSRTGIELPRTDLRTVAARRLRGLIAAYESELGDNLGEAEKAMIRQVCSLQLRIEQLETAIVEGRDVNADEIIRLSSERRRLLTGLRGRAVKAKPAGPLLQDYIREHYGEPAETSENVA